MLNISIGKTVTFFICSNSTKKYLDTNKVRVKNLIYTKGLAFFEARETHVGGKKL